MLQSDASIPAIAESSRDSLSSNGSWMRRLSIRPLSQHGSPRSSVFLDSHSIAFSHGSGAPILSPTGTAAPNLPPNKLVKRTPSFQYVERELLSQRRSRPHLPTLRRPATSHQRSATLNNQLQADLDLRSPPSPSEFSFRAPDNLPAPNQIPQTSAKAAWISFFHSRTANLNFRVSTGRASDFSQYSRNPPAKRICPESDQKRRVHLIKPSLVSVRSERLDLPTLQADEEEQDAEVPFGERQQGIDSADEATPTKRARRSLSMTFSSASNWVSRTSGSIRRPKRGAEQMDGNKRHVSDPVGGRHQRGADTTHYVPGDPTIPPNALEQQGSALDSAALGTQHPSRKRNISTPLPPLSRLSTFQVDLSRLGSAGGASSHPLRSNQPSGSSSSSMAMSQFKSTHNDKTSMRESSEADTRDFVSGDDDDTDFKSDTMFDSIRTGASGRVRAVESPLESMYDESPPSTAGNGKTKRLSIQEILGKAWDEDNKIMEEDEGLSTPIHATHLDGDASHVDMRLGLQPSPEGLSLPSKEFGRLSLDDDFDDDWAKDDDIPWNPLSPPSKANLVTSRTVNPNVRLALANISGNGLADTSSSDGQTERPLSTLFDWSEPSLHEKYDTDGQSLRPRTAYAKEMDSRGGRSVIRKGPTPTHVRSQSVPVVHDVPEDAKAAGSKYGTWGLGTKTISEDWGDDFEFNSGGASSNDKGNQDLFPVPESIRATQPSVKAHSGQIRELSLLVNDLKRLCRHGREMEMLDGPQKGLWKEAEGIIALASPDDEDEDGDKPHNEDHETTSSIDFDNFEAGERMLDGESDAASLEILDAALEGREPVMSRTAVVRERQSPRRRSVFSPDDDIFGGNWPTPEANVHSNRSSRPRTPDSRITKSNDVNGVVRSMVEAVQLKSASGASHGSGSHKNKMHFDTNSLKALVKRAGDLRDLLSDIVRRADQLTQSPARTPRRERHQESSPAFTRVFDDPASSPPRRIQVMPVK